MIKNALLLAIVISISSIMMSSSVTADEILTAEQVKKLFSGKTFDGHHETKGFDFRIYAAPDGNFSIVQDSGKKKKKYWLVDDKGRHCVSRKKNVPGRCSTVISTGNGVYKKMTMGIHSHTLKNFVDGKQL